MDNTGPEAMAKDLVSQYFPRHADEVWEILGAPCLDGSKIKKISDLTNTKKEAVHAVILCLLDLGRLEAPREEEARYRARSKEAFRGISTPNVRR